ncbi:hypothetical protein HQO83_05270 [Rhodococcus fascians]|nr:hypothetical protein [Rhodococcus fascians]
MKRLLLATTIAAVTVLTTVACGGGAEQTATSSTSTESATGEADAPGPTGIPDGMGSGAADGVPRRTQPNLCGPE